MTPNVPTLFNGLRAPLEYVGGLALALVLAAAVTACSDAPVAADPCAASPAVVDLVDNTAWVQTPEASDPFFADHGADATVCPDTEYGPETLDGVWFSVATQACAYLTVHQPLLHDIPAGSTVSLRIWHYGINTPEGPFFLALAVGEPAQTVWSEVVEVPADSGLFYEQVTLDEGLTAGDRVYWHLSNHGENEWSFIELSLGEEPPAECQ